MADYWKSNARKYCEFCKCWIADNKISVTLHEDGKRHKINVAKKISVITKQSAKDRKAQNKIDVEMAKMERIAMAAYMKDIEKNADLTSQIINEKLSTKSRIDVLKPALKKPSETPSSGYYSEKKLVWHEAKNEGGHSYYWNTVTNEAAWEPPPEGFIPYSSLKAQGPSKAPPKPPKKSKKKKGPSRSDAPVEPTEPEESKEPFDFIPLTNPYGSWVAVHQNLEVDLQLPEKKSDTTPVAPRVVPVLPKEKQFKEKLLVSVASEDDNPIESGGFKKRKIINNTKRNTRQRLDDDD